MAKTSVEVGDRVTYTRIDYPGGTMDINVMSATVVKIGEKRIKIRLDKPFTPLRYGFKFGKPIIETWVEPHSIGLPMRKDYHRAGCMSVIIIGFIVLVGSLTLLTLII